jgi:glycosyltransferase involved in cell wall biosynthesis
MSVPELSVCIPTYNAAHFLPDAIGSVMRQGLTDFEIVIVDNDSQDGTETLVHSLANERIRYFRNETNMGPHESFKRCLAEARGEFVKYLCADDVLLHGVLQKQMEVLRSRPEVSLVSCNMFVTGPDLHIERLWTFFPGSCRASRVKNACLSGLANYIGGPSNFMFRRARSGNLLFETRYKAVGDLKLALQLLEQGDYANIDEAGHLYRRHSQSDTIVTVTDDMQKMEPIRLVDEFDWWNPLSCFFAIRRDGVGWRKAVNRNWWRALLPGHILNAFTAAFDILRLTMSKRRNSRRQL